MCTPTNKIRGYRWILNDRKFADLIYLANFSDVTHLLRMNDNFMNDIFKLKDGAVKLLFPLVITINLLLNNMHWILHVHRGTLIQQTPIYNEVLDMMINFPYRSNSKIHEKEAQHNNTFCQSLGLISRFYYWGFILNAFAEIMNGHFVVIWWNWLLHSNIATIRV